ncbi:MAG: S8 family serine peptidase [Bryobacteraceae bacterium]|nr:S8 family serine peptidase [Bryobacteraceae bacterium]
MTNSAFRSRRRRWPGLLLLLLFSAVFLRAQVVPGHYIVELEGEPAASGADRLPKARRAAYIKDREAAIQSRQRAMRALLARYGARTYASVQTVANALMVQLPDELAARLSSVTGVERVYPVYEIRPSLDAALPLHKAPEAWARLGGADLAGVGAKIAIIDTGIDQTHPGFQDPTLPMPEGFPRANTETHLSYTSNKVIVARSYLSLYGTEPDSSPADTLGHGTGVAMIAAGVSVTSPRGVISGIAPKAYLGAYNVFQRNGSTRSDLVFKAVDDAVSDGMDVINISLGSAFATRPADTPFPAIVERATTLGALIVIAVGNDGPEPFTISDYAVAPASIAVGATSSSRVFSGSVRLATGRQFLAIPGSGPNSATPIAAPLFDVAAVDPSGLACGSLPGGNLAGRIALILRGTCTFETKLTNAEAAGAVAAIVYTQQEQPDPITMSVGSATLPGVMVSYVDGIAIKQAIAATAALTATVDFSTSPVAVDPNRLIGFSGLGPSTDFAIKPDLVATGTEVSAEPGGYTYASGTSFAAPLVSGAAALLQAARPGYSGIHYRSMLINAATPLVFASGAAAGVQEAGGGVLNMDAALTTATTAYPTSISFGTTPGNLSRRLAIFNLGAAQQTYAISAQPFTGLTPGLSAGSIVVPPRDMRAITVSLPAQGATGKSEGMIRINGSAGTADIHVPYWFAVPSSTPAYLKIVDQDESGSPGALMRSAISIRVTDASGIPILDPAPRVTVVSGGGSVVAVFSSDESFPGLYEATVRLGPEPGDNVFRVEAGTLSREVTIQAGRP